MQYKILGHSDIKVSTLTFGCWSIVADANWGDQGEKESTDAIHAALDAGINFFDTAPAYGNGASENLLGKALKNRRSEVVIATKIVGSLNRARVITECEESLKRLQIETIDLYQIHWADPQTPIEETLSAIEELKRQGKIRLFGVSNFGRNALTDALAHGRIASNQMAYNLLWRGIEDEVLPLCQHEDIGILCYSTLMQGLLTGKFKTADDVPDGRARTVHFSGDRPNSRHGQAGFEEETFETLDALRAICANQNLSMIDASMQWLLARPGVTSVIAGARNAAQVRDQVNALETGISAETQAALTLATDALKTRFAGNMDLWAETSRIQ